MRTAALWIAAIATCLGYLYLGAYLDRQALLHAPIYVGESK